MTREDTLDAAESLKAMMVARVTTRDDPVDNRAFTRARNVVLADPVGRRHAPSTVRTCRSLDEVWSHVKAHDPPLDTYESRRNHFRAEFEPLLSALECFGTSPLDDIASEKVGVLDSASVAHAWSRALVRRTEDPEGAITAARAMVESVCKTILDDLEVDYGEKDDLPKLYRSVAAVLELTPEQRSDEQVKRILGGCASAVEGLGSLRNRAGDAHGKGRIAYRLGPRHATLAVNLAGTIAIFLIETHEHARG
jgi:hypothetical protein